MLDLIKEYEKNKELYAIQLNAIDEKRESINRRIERAKKQLEALERKHKKLDRPSKYGLFEEIAKKVAEHLNLHYVIYGPFGMECETSAYFVEDPNKSITEQKTLSLTVRLWRSSDENWFEYDTGKRTNEYKKGSIGYYNGLNSVYAPLPYSFEKIIEIIKQNKEDAE